MSHIAQTCLWTWEVLTVYWPLPNHETCPFRNNCDFHFIVSSFAVKIYIALTHCQHPCPPALRFLSPDMCSSARVVQVWLHRPLQATFSSSQLPIHLPPSIQSKHFLDAWSPSVNIFWANKWTLMAPTLNQKHLRIDDGIRSLTSSSLGKTWHFCPNPYSYAAVCPAWHLPSCGRFPCSQRKATHSSSLLAPDDL